MSEKTKLPVYMDIVTAFRLDKYYKDDGSKSKTAFVVNAINHYIDALEMGSLTDSLPAAVTAAIDGRLGMSDDRNAAMLFKLAVEMDMVANIVCATNDIDEETLGRLRNKCEKDVRCTNGKVTFMDALKLQKGD